MEKDIILKKDITSLNDVYTIYQKWISIQNTIRIDIGLALRLISRIHGTKVWLIIVGPSGDWKTEQLIALTDGEKETKVIHQMSSKTLVNGFKDKKKYPDLAPKLDNKMLMIYDMAQLLKLHPNEKAEVWAQLRDLYDGFAGKQSGQGLDISYKDLNVTLIGASTPAIDTQLLIHQDLGTRELIWRCYNAEKVGLAGKAWDNEPFEELMREELKEVTNNFLRGANYDTEMVITPEVKDFLEKQAIKLAYLRATAQTDSYSGELLNDVTPERPTRVLKQLKRVYIALKCLSWDYSDSRAYDVIKHLVSSSGNPLRYTIINLLNKSGTVNTNKVAEKLKVGYKTAYRELNLLWNLGVIHRDMVEEARGGRIIEFHSWSINPDNYFIQNCMDEVSSGN